MNILVIGSGGREHALSLALSKSNHCDTLFVIPGNPGMNEIATCININPMSNTEIREFSLKNNIKLIIPGSEVYLENGIVDTFHNDDIIVFGPNKKAARIESSKEFAKDLMAKYNIPTATYQVFDNYNKALDYVHEVGTPIVLKYDGLAGGKGVVVAMNIDDAVQALKDMLLDKKYGHSKVVIEEYLEGPEFSFMTFVHNGRVIPMPIAQDHKRLLDGDNGPNTGGMGIYSSVPIINKDSIDFAYTQVMQKTVDAMIKENSPFTGFLYGGLMDTKDGPKVIEFNARFGDPETEVILPKLQTDFVDIILSLFNETIIDIKWNNDYILGVVMASKGYPNSYTKGHEIKGLELIDDLVFHMGTTLTNNKLVTNGGRVLLVTGSGPTLKQAKEKAYENIKKIQCDNLIYRTDIGYKAL